MNELKHYGVKGMHWGVRRYQNYDGTRIGSSRNGGGSWGTNDKGSIIRKTVSKGTNDRPLGEKVKRTITKQLNSSNTSESLGKKNGINAYRKKVTYGEEPEGYSAKRQRQESKLRYEIKNESNLKNKIALKKELKNYTKESDAKAKEYREWLRNVREYTGDYKQYEAVKNGDKWTNEWINKRTGQVITNKEYYDSFHYDATRNGFDYVSDFLKRNI